MQFIGLIITLSIFIVGVIIARTPQPPDISKGKDTNDHATSSATPIIITPEPLSTKTPITPQPTPLPTHTPSPTSPTSQSSLLDKLIYPNATKLNQSSSSLILESQDNHNTITNWYQDKLKEFGFNSISIAKTTANDEVKNQLSGSDGSTSVTIDITKSSGNNKTKITVNLN